MKTNETKDGGPAFPVDYGPDGTPGYDPGMTLRDWFAGQALAGLIASKAHSVAFHAEHDAAYCYRVADAMLAEREES